MQVLGETFARLSVTSKGQKAQKYFVMFDVKFLTILDCCHISHNELFWFKILKSWGGVFYDNPNWILAEQKLEHFV